MRFIVLSILAALFCYDSFCQEKSEHENLQKAILEISPHRMQKNLEFRNPDTSPLPNKEIKDFKGLNYYEETSAKYTIWASFELVENGREFEMKTTTDRLPKYRDYAILSFEIDGKQFSLHAYQNVAFSESEDYDNSLFIPFKDHTNGDETYGGGRYLDVEIPEDDKIFLNFAMAYNPYCSYNKKYSCPIPPNENHLDIAIPVGEKKYH